MLMRSLSSYSEHPFRVPNEVYGCMYVWTIQKNSQQRPHDFLATVVILQWEHGTENKRVLTSPKSVLSFIYGEIISEQNGLTSVIP